MSQCPGGLPVEGVVPERSVAPHQVAGTTPRVGPLRRKRRPCLSTGRRFQSPSLDGEVALCAWPKRGVLPLRYASPAGRHNRNFGLIDAPLSANLESVEMEAGRAAFERCPARVPKLRRHPEASATRSGRRRSRVGGVLRREVHRTVRASSSSSATLRGESQRDEPHVKLPVTKQTCTVTPVVRNVFQN